MNQKDTRQQIQFPPLLNLANDRPHIDSNFQNFEKQNSPYLNGMIQPIYTKEISGTAVYDKSGNRYTIDNTGKIKKNNNLIQTVNPYHFEKEEVFFEGKGTSCADFYQIFDDTNNTIKVYSKNGLLVFTSPTLFSTGLFMKARINTFTDRNDNKYFVSINVYRDENDKLQLKIFCQYNNETKGAEIKWRQYITHNDIMEYHNVDIDSPNILIQSAQITDGNYDIFWITLFSDYGEVISSKDLGICNYLFGYTQDGNISPIGKEGEPDFIANGTSKTVQDLYSAGFTVRTTTSTETFTSAYMNLASTNGVDYYTPIPQVYNYNNSFGTFYIKGRKPDMSSITQHTYGSSGYYFGIPPNNLEQITSYMTGAAGNTVPYYRTRSTITVECDTGSINWEFRAHPKIAPNDWQYSNNFDVDQDKPITRTNQTKSMYYDTWWALQDDAITGYDDLEIYWYVDNNQTEPVYTPIPAQYWNNETMYIERHSHHVETVYTSLVPNGVLDNGKVYAFYDFHVVTENSWPAAYGIKNGYEILESGAPSFSTSGSTQPYQVTYTPVEEFSNNSGSEIFIRSRGITLGQNFYQSFTRLSTMGKLPKDLCPTYDSSGNIITQASADIETTKYIEYINTNSSDMRYSPGSVYDRQWNYYGYGISDELYKGNTLDALSWVPGGFRADLDDHWHLLYNIYSNGQATIQGISYSENAEDMGTLVAPWTSIDPTFDIFVSDNGTAITYKDIDGHYYKISIDSGAELSTILDDRYVIINTTSYWNAFDTEINKWYHYANDYNGRLVQGINTYEEWTPTDSGIRVIANAINYNYNEKPKIAFTSNHYPYNTVQRCTVGHEVIPSSIIPESIDAQAIDVYYSDVNKTACKYRYSLLPQISLIHTKNFQLINTTYQITSTGTAYLTPSIFAKYINGQGNNDLIIENNYGYPLQYAEDTPILCYSLASETDNASDFFVLQGQFYGVINDKIYAMTYTDGIITDKQAIVDIRGFKFIGNTTQISFWWSPRYKSLYSFTGDAVLLHLFDASKIDEISGEYFYDESTQSIFVPTSKGLLVLGPKNTFFIEDWKNVRHVYFDKQHITHVVFDDKVIDFVYFPMTNYTAKKIELETSFWGIGANENLSIDRFDIVLYDISGEKQTSSIKVGTRTITDVTVKSEEKVLKITPDMYDNWSNSVLVSYSPKLIKGKGIRLYLDTDLAVQSISAHVTDNGTGTATGKNRSI